MATTDGGGYQRVRTYASDEVEAGADDYWRMLTDWPTVADWMRVEGRPVPLIASPLKEGHELGRLPCTRLATFDVAALPPGVDIPEIAEETLLHADPVARFLYYNIEGIGPFGMRNYLAITEVDELGPNRIRVTCSGRFDLPPEAPAELVKTVIESVYDCVIHDIPKAIAARV